MLRFWVPISLVAAVGIIVSTAVGIRFYRQEIANERNLLDRSVDAHAGLIQERLDEREVLARMAAAMFTAPNVIERDPLAALRAPFRSLKADLVAVGWIPRVEPAQVDDALQALAANGMTPPRLLGGDGKALDPHALTRPMYPVIDVEPRTPDNLRILGIDVAADPQSKAAIDFASDTGTPFATDPRPLRQAPSHLGVILFAPVFRAGDHGPPAGFVSFAYQLNQLLTHVGEDYPFIISFADPQNLEGQPMFSLAPDGTLVRNAERDPAHDADVRVRKLHFGTRQWTVYYEPIQEPGYRALLLGVNAAAIGLALTSIIVGLFGYVVHNNLRLSNEVQSRIAVEQRLNSVIRELNHRVKNMLAVIQSIVVRSLRSGTIVDEARELVAGRLHAMSHAVSLLTETEWQGISLRDLFSSQVLPVTSRIAVEGPDVVIGARAAQALALLLYELAANANKYGALSTPVGGVTVRWSVDGGGTEARFHFRWEETGGAPPADPQYSGFGHIVLDRVAPDAVRGVAKRFYGANGFVYELEAPLWGLGDKGRAD
ncbi:MAG: CHASE domain-containing protein [Xanthobacteraceae bacterium]|nr:CHASE domain-containing protein [Xanthobacteraceae bacterium]